MAASTSIFPPPSVSVSENLFPVVHPVPDPTVHTGFAPLSSSSSSFSHPPRLKDRHPSTAPSEGSEFSVGQIRPHSDLTESRDSGGGDTCGGVSVLQELSVTKSRACGDSGEQTDQETDGGGDGGGGGDLAEPDDLKVTVRSLLNSSVLL